MIFPPMRERWEVLPSFRLGCFVHILRDGKRAMAGSDGRLMCAHGELPSSIRGWMARENAYRNALKLWEAADESSRGPPPTPAFRPPYCDCQSVAGLSSRECARVCISVGPNAEGGAEGGAKGGACGGKHGRGPPLPPLPPSMYDALKADPTVATFESDNRRSGGGGASGGGKVVDDYADDCADEYVDDSEDERDVAKDAERTEDEGEATRVKGERCEHAESDPPSANETDVDVVETGVALPFQCRASVLREAADTAVRDGALRTPLSSVLPTVQESREDRTGCHIYLGRSGTFYCHHGFSFPPTFPSKRVPRYGSVYLGGPVAKKRRCSERRVLRARTGLCNCVLALPNRTNFPDIPLSTRHAMPK